MFNDGYFTTAILLFRNIPKSKTDYDISLFIPNYVIFTLLFPEN